MSNTKNVKFFIQCNQSKKTNNVYRALYADFGYRVCLVSMDTALICELAGMHISELYALKVGEVKYIEF